MSDTREHHDAIRDAIRKICIENQQTLLDLSDASRAPVS